MRRSILILLSALLAGCGPTSPSVVPATGIVTHEGVPVAQAVVVFLPENASEATRGGQAETDESGRFTLSTYHQGTDFAGIAPGTYHVGITKLEPVTDMRQPPKHLLPQKYRLPKTSGLTATVRADGENDFVFDL